MKMHTELTERSIRYQGSMLECTSTGYKNIFVDNLTLIFLSGLGRKLSRYMHTLCVNTSNTHWRLY